MRWWIRSRARARGLAGWARNLDDGRVEVVAEGPRNPACRALLARTYGTAPPVATAPPGRVEVVVERVVGGARRCHQGLIER